MPRTVRFTRKELARLKKAYNKAIKSNAETFVYKRTVLLTSYAKYLIEYLDGYFKD